MAGMKNLDFKTAGFWPAPMKMMAYFAAFATVLVMAWVFWFSSEVSSLNNLKKKETDLKTEYQKVQEKANRLQSLKKQLEELDALLKTLVMRLPSKNEIPELVINVSKTAQDSNLNVDLFKPLEESAKEFYAEKRIDVKFRGDYHQFAEFFNDVAKQPRLVAVVVDDMKVTMAKEEKAKTPAKDAKNTTSAGTLNDISVKAPELLFEGSVRTYRYLSDDELASSKPAEKDDKKKAGKKPAKKASKDKEEEK